MGIKNALRISHSVDTDADSHLWGDRGGETEGARVEC